MYEIIGFIAGFLVSIALLPQVIKTWRSKSSKNISLSWTIILMSGLFLWIVYAFIYWILPLFIFGLVEFSMVLTLFVFKFLYK
ncbi:MAG: PQ-loop domain-containing transporter [Candidatus Thermoplasmatota archaeon]|nr:PQ-loop domain-containing transporter [Candidatus Thermoplasmatota archaeon]